VTRASLAFDEVNLQLRDQHDNRNTLLYQSSRCGNSLPAPWATLLTGFEFVHATIDTAHDGRPSQYLQCLCAGPRRYRAGCSSNGTGIHVTTIVDVLLYTTDKIDATDRFKVRAVVRQDWLIQG
jgi:hypothetical protein